MATLNTSSATAAPRSVHQLDEGRLLQFLRMRLPHLCADAPNVVVQQFQHGQSNPTYLLTLGQQQLVLRKQPPGKLLASAHAVDREFRVLTALSKSNVPVPTPLAFCSDLNVIGTPFYVMAFAQGQIYLDPNLPQEGPRDRSRIFARLVDTLAGLHSIDPAAAGLADYGMPQDYCRRQVARWAKQYHASVPQPAPQVLQLIDWLQHNVPAEDAAPSQPAIIHGDYRLDNLVFDEGLQVVAVLDWELSTLGNPWSDVAYLAMAYHLPPSFPKFRLFYPLAGGVPSEEALLARYCAARGVELPDPRSWGFYLALSMFRMLAILAGVQARVRQGNASSAAAAALSSDSVQASLAHAALNIISRAEEGASLTEAPATAASSSTGSHKGQPAHQQQQQRTVAMSSSYSSSISNRGVQQAKGGNKGTSGAAASAMGDQHGPSSTSITSSSSRAPMLGGLSPRAAVLVSKLHAFMEAWVFPNETLLEEHHRGADRWQIHPLTEQLKEEARKAGLWNLWLPADLASHLGHLLPLVPPEERQLLLGSGLTNLEYAHCCEVMGRSLWAPEAFNCSAPDTGNMEVLGRYGTRQQQQKWLLPLLRGQMRSCFAMTEKAVASSDATNITSAIRAAGPAASSSLDDGDSSSSKRGPSEYVVDGVKWWTSGAMDPRCKVAIFMGKTDPTAASHRQQSMILVPMDAPGVAVVRPLLVYGFDDAPHGHAEVHFSGVRVPAANLLLGEGRGFEIAQGRLGPGRLHHCMRLIGAAERALQLLATRSLSRVAFKKPLAAQGGLRETLARKRVEVDGARLLVLQAAHALDCVGHKKARGEIAAAKVAAPAAALSALDAAIQVHGGAGVCQDFVLAHLWAAARTLRIADGPDEVHLGTIALLELGRAAPGGAAELKALRAKL